MNKPEIIQLPKIADARGNLSFFETSKHRRIPMLCNVRSYISDPSGS